MRIHILILLVSLFAGLTGCGEGPDAVQKVTVNVQPPPTTPSVTPTIPTTPVVPAAPVLTVYDPTNVTFNSATLRGNINYVWGNTGVTGFQWGVVNADGNVSNWTPEYIDHHPTGNVFVSLLGKLQQGTRYGYQLFLSLGVGQPFLSPTVVKFTTPVLSPPIIVNPPTITPTVPDVTPTVPTVTPTTPSVTPTIPTTPTGPTNPTTSVVPTAPVTPVVSPLTALDPSNLSANSATLHGNINYTWPAVTSDGFTVTGVTGFQYMRTNSDPNWTPKFLNGHPTGNVSVNLDGKLRPSTDYSYRLFLALSYHKENNPPQAPEDRNATYYSNVSRFITPVAVAALSAGSSLPNGFAPSSKAKATEILPDASSIIVDTEGYTNLGEDYVTLHGFVDFPSKLAVLANVFFQISDDGGENWYNWYSAGQSKIDGSFAVSLGNLFKNTRYFYRIGAGFSPENIVYGYSREFTTLASSDVRAGELRRMEDILTQVNDTVDNAGTVLTISSKFLQFHPKSVARNNDIVSNALSSGQILNLMSQSSDIDGAISADLARRIIKGLNKVSALRYTVQPYFQTVYDLEMVNPYSTNDEPLSPSYEMGKAALAGSVGSSSSVSNVYGIALQLTGRGKLYKASVAASSETGSTANVEIPSDLLLEVVRALIDGVNTLADRTRSATYQDYDNSQGWTENYVYYLANRAFIAARTLYDLSLISSVNDLLSRDMKIQISNLKESMKSFRTEVESFRDRANATSRSQFRWNASNLQRRYVDGQSDYGQKG